MRKLFIFIVCLFISNAIIAQHFGGLFFSGDIIPKYKNYMGSEETGNYLKDHNFSNGYAIGYKGLLMEQRRFSFTYGMQYAYRATYVDNFGAPWGCLTGLENYEYEPVKLKETWKNIEIPIGARYNILKETKFQPYASFSIILFYPISYDAKLINYLGEETHSPWLNDNYKRRIDGSIEFGIGLNYRAKKYVFNVEPSYRPCVSHGFQPHEGQGKIGLGFAVLRKF